MGVNSAATHPGDGDETEAEHVKQDLASTSIEQIERETRANRSQDQQGYRRYSPPPNGGTDSTQRESVTSRGSGPRPGWSLELGASHRRRVDFPGGVAEREGADLGFGGRGSAEIVGAGPGGRVPVGGTDRFGGVVGGDVQQ
jgi:hypothetical protein